MKGPLLFLFTIMLVTPGGRGEMQEFVDRTNRYYELGAPYTSLMLALTAGIILVILLMLRRRKPVFHQPIIIIRYQVMSYNPRLRRKSRLAWLRRLPGLKRLSWA